MRSHKLSRRALMGLFAVAVTAVAATTTGLALADESQPPESQPSVQVALCKDGAWNAQVTGVNQRGENISDTFDGAGCTVLAKNGTGYWWAIGQDRELTVHVEGSVQRFNLRLGADMDGQTVTHEIQPHPGIL